MPTVEEQVKENPKDVHASTNSMSAGV